jgi:hypothetical protein
MSLLGVLRFICTWICNYHVHTFTNKSVPFDMELHIWVLDALSTEHIYKLDKKWGVILRGKLPENGCLPIILNNQPETTIVKIISILSNNHTMNLSDALLLRSLHLDNHSWLLSTPPL